MESETDFLNRADSGAHPEESYSDEEDPEIRNHHTYEQVMLDVNRCAGRLEDIRKVYLHRTDEDICIEDLSKEFKIQKIIDSSSENPAETSNGDRDHSRSNSNPDVSLKNQKVLDQRAFTRKLARLIVRLLKDKPDLHYYQGFHDVCLTYMTILNEEEAYSKLIKLVDSHFKIFMHPTMIETQDFLALIPIIIGLHDTNTLNFLERSEVGTIFALSWVITWFSHVIPNQLDVKRIFEFLENRDPHMILYVCSEIVIYKREALLKLEPEMSVIHHFLCQLPRKDKLPIKMLLERAEVSFSKWSPELLKKKLRDHRNRRIQNYAFLGNLASRLHSLRPNTKAAVLIIILASVITLNYEKWFR